MPEALSIAIVGTAGRAPDHRRLTGAHWWAMTADAHARVADLLAARGLGPAEARLISGGAAWADHLAVRLWRAGAAAALTLHLPAGLAPYSYRRDTAVGRSMNHFHHRFAARTGVDSLVELADAAHQGAHVAIHDGRAARNAAVAGAADAVLAYTCPGTQVLTAAPGTPAFADPSLAGILEPGTADTWWRATGARIKVHVPVGTLPTGRGMGG